MAASMILNNGKWKWTHAKVFHQCRYQLVATITYETNLSQDRLW